MKDNDCTFCNRKWPILARLLWSEHDFPSVNFRIKGIISFYASTIKSSVPVAHELFKRLIKITADLVAMVSKERGESEVMENFSKQVANEVQGKESKQTKIFRELNFCISFQH